MNKLISIAISAILLCFNVSCVSIPSSGLKSADDQAPVNNRTSDPGYSVVNSCPIVSALPANIGEPSTFPQLSEVAQGPDFQAKYQEILSPHTMYPAFGCTVFTLTPGLKWQSSEYQSTYSLQISTNQGFTDLVVNLSGIQNAYYDIPSGIFKWDQAYYWRVNARNLTGTNSTWSNPGYFSVIQEFGFHE